MKDSTKPIKDKVLARIQTADGKKHLGKYVHRGTMGIEEVCCKCCGDPVRKLMPDENFTEERIVNGKHILVQRLILGTLSNYSEVRIEFDDGSRHITTVCEHCGPKLTVDDLEWLYCSDLQEWMVDGDHANPSFWEAMDKRKPIGFVVFPPGVVAS